LEIPKTNAAFHTSTSQQPQQQHTATKTQPKHQVADLPLSPQTAPIMMTSTLVSVDMASSESLVGSLVAFGAIAVMMTRMKRQASSAEDLLDRNNEPKEQDEEDDNDDEWFLQNMPKIELHVHLDGAFDPEEIWNHVVQHPELLQCLPVEKKLPWSKENDPPLFLRDILQACQSPTEFRQLCTCRRRYRSLRVAATAATATAVVPPTTDPNYPERKRQHPPPPLPPHGKQSVASLTDMLLCFEFFLPLVCDNLLLLERLAYDFVLRQAEQNVIYTEVRYSPHYLAHDPYQAHAAVTRGLRRGCQDHPTIVVNQILCAINFRPDWSQDIVKMAHQLRKDVPCAVVGIDIAAGEDHFAEHSSLRQGHYDMCQEAQELGLNITLHAGETPASAHNVVTAITDYGAKRIGHGYHSTEFPEMLQLLKARGVHMEVCPTSSAETGGWDKEKPAAAVAVRQTTLPWLSSSLSPWHRHPANIFQQHGISQSLSSDDPAVFNTSLTWQYRMALTKMQWSRDELIQMTRDAVRASFLPEPDQHQLMQRLDQELSTLDQSTKHGRPFKRHHHYKDRVHYE
jgi:adenosine deaminase